MKKKLLLGIMLTVFLVIVLFNGIPVKASPGWEPTPIKIGAVGPMPWIQGAGIDEGCRLAAEQINLGPNGLDESGGGDDGIIVGGKHYKVEIVTADDLRGMPDPTGLTGTAAAMELVAAGVDFVVGGFRTESCRGIREVLMDYKKIWYISGAATNELVDCGTGTCGKCVRDNYDRYKYTFRVTPINDTQLLYSIAGFLKFLMMARLMPMYTGYAFPLKIAVVSEALTWADRMHGYMASSTFWNSPSYMNMSAYGNVTVVYSARISPVTTDVSAELAGVKASGARLLIEVISGPSGRTMAKQWYDMGVNAFLAGIDVPGQEIPLHWEATGGKAEYETFLATCGTETPIFARTLAYYNAYMAKYGHAPIYTSYGAYDAVIAIEQMFELGADGVAGSGDEPFLWLDPAKPEYRKSDYLVPFIEKGIRDGTKPVWDYCLGRMDTNVGIFGKFKYTSVHPMGSVTYGTKMANATDSYLAINPTMQGTLHDVYCDMKVLNPYGQDDALGPFWVYKYARAFNFQWQKVKGEGRLEHVFPIDQAYSTKVKIPPRMYPLAETDISPNGAVDGTDLGVMGLTWLSTPGTAAWMGAPAYTFPGLLADMDYDKIITIADASVVARDFGKTVADFGLTWPLP